MKKIVLSGSSSGVGLALTQRLLAEGIAVVGLARDHAKAQLNHPNWSSYTVDFSQSKNLEQQLKQIQQAHPDVDAIVANAGYGQFAELEQFSYADMQKMMQVNFLSQALFIKTFLSRLKQKQQGKVIIMGSECAVAGAKKATMYCASKFALRGFAQSLRQECAKSGVGVSLINPGLVRTPFYDKLNFKPGEQESNGLKVSDVVSVIMQSLLMPAHCLAEEINLQAMNPQVRMTSI